MHPPPDNIVLVLVQWLRLVIEIVGAGTIAIGAAISLLRFVRALVSQRHADFNAIRLTLARYLALALEFQLGADILSTAVAPSWEEIGKLGAIAVIRTGLNFFLSREMKEAQETEAHETKAVEKAKGNNASVSD